MFISNCSGMGSVQITFVILCFLSTAKLGICKGNDFMFALVQEWPPGLCKIYQSTGAACDIPKSAKPWLIHGLWMEKGPKGHKDVENCTFSEEYKDAYMKPIMDKMNIYWPSIFKKVGNTDFWQHEWSRHGRCCTKCLKLSNQTTYFSAALDLRQKYDLSSLLAKKKVVPNNNRPYKTSEVTKMINEWFGKEAFLRCGNIKGKSYFFRVMLCFDGSLNPVDCEKVSSLADEMGKPSQKCSKSMIYPAMPQAQSFL